MCLTGEGEVYFAGEADSRLPRETGIYFAGEAELSLTDEGECFSEDGDL